MEPQKLKEKLRGIQAFAVTPFLPDLSLDLEGLERNIKFLVQERVHVVVICGGTGEFFSLTPDEYGQVVSTAVHAAGKAVPIVAGVGYGMKQASHLAQMAQETGADGLLLMPPYFVRPSEGGLYAHYKAIAEAVEIGVIIYSRGWAVYSPDLLAKLAEIDNVIGFKDEHGDVRLFAEVRARVGDRLAWINGMAEMMAPFYFVAGAQSITSGIANFAPRISLAVYEALTKEDYVRVRELLQTQVKPIARLRGKRPGYQVPVVKAAMDMLGLAGGVPRPPLMPILEEDREELAQVLRDLGLFQ